MKQTILILLVIVAVVAANDSYKSNHKPSYRQDYSHVPNYKFEWAVQDDNNDYGQFENREGDITDGGYHVALPDGRQQTVTYRDDGYAYSIV